MGLGDSYDYYKFDFAAPAQSTIRLYNMTGGNADLTLYDAKGVQMKKSARAGSQEDIITVNLAVGTYYARVNAVSGNIDYKLDFSEKDIVSGMLAS
ncbi:MAG: PPC domain-containing protein [Victivallaceae bacterium]